MVSATQAVFVALAGILAIFYSGKGSFVLKKVTEFGYGKPGCAPIGNIGNVTLHYFEGRGRGEPIRLLLEDVGTVWSEVNFNKDTWPAFKSKGIESGLYTFGQVPALETSIGIKLVQSQAILHFLGRATGLDCDCEDLHKCEILAAGVEDAGSKLTKMVYDPQWNLKDRDHYLNEVLPMWLGYFEKLAPSLALQRGAFFASKRLTWVDFLVFDLLDTNLEFAKLDFGTNVKVDVLADFPKLNNFYKQFNNRPKIAKYLRSEARFPYKIKFQPKK